MKKTDFERDENGLLKTIHYPTKADGSVNWRALIPPAYLYVNPDYEEQLKTRFNVKSRRDIDPTKVEDYQLLVMLDGWRELLRLRGYRSIRYPTVRATELYASVTCEIEFTGNFETDMQPVVHTETAGANLHNVSGKFQLFLETQAANRALARCVRTFLNVPVYGKDEFDPEMNKAFEESLKKGENPLLSPIKPVLQVAKADAASTSTPLPTDPLGLLKMKCQTRAKPISFEGLRKSAVKIKSDLVSDPDTWTDWTSIPPKDIYTLSMKIDEKSKP